MFEVAVIPFHFQFTGLRLDFLFLSFVVLTVILQAPLARNMDKCLM